MHQLRYNLCMRSALKTTKLEIKINKRTVLQVNATDFGVHSSVLELLKYAKQYKFEVSLRVLMLTRKIIISLFCSSTWNKRAACFQIQF